MSTLSLTTPVDDIERFVNLVFQPGELVELRMLRSERPPASGYFSDPDALASAAGHWSGKLPVYFTLNEPKRSAIRGNENQVRNFAGHGQTTSDHEIERRRLLLVDCDPVRVDDAATKQELEAALDRARNVREFLRSLGWPEPLFATSGNGGHLLYRIDLPADDGGLVSGALRSLAERFNDAAVKVDTRVSNAARICRFYGTLNTKGDNSPERPHRLAEIIDAPDRLVTVARELLENLAGPVGEPQPAGDVPTSSLASFGLDFDLKGFLDNHWPDYQTKQDGDKGTIYQLRKCPFHDHAQDYKAAVWLWGGSPVFKCFAEKCADKTFRDFCAVAKPQPEAAADKPKGKRDNEVLRAMKLAERDELFHCPDGFPYATYEINGHRETAMIGDDYQTVLRLRYLREYGKSIKQGSLTEAIANLVGIARYECPQFDVYLRAAEYDGCYYIDLADAARRAIKVSASGWEIVPAPAGVRFRRPAAMLPLPEPQRGGSIDLLGRYVNVRDEDMPLVVGFAVGALRPGEPPCPLLSLAAQGGCAKTTSARVLQRLIDPNAGDVRGEPKNVQDLMLHARNCWLPVIDNIGKIDSEMSNALCRIITGGGQGSRELFTNLGEVIFKVRRPMILTSVQDVVSAADLADRSIVISPPLIRTYRSEREFWATFDNDRPMILGALLDGLVAGLRGFAGVQVKSPRMSDFAQFVTAAEAAYGYKSQTILSAYNSCQQRAALEIIANSPLGKRLVELAKEGFTGTASALLAELGEGDWPDKPQTLANEIRALAPDLRKAGVSVETGMQHGRTVWAFECDPALALYCGVDPLIAEIDRLAPMLARVGVYVETSGDRVRLWAA